MGRGSKGRSLQSASQAQARASRLSRQRPGRPSSRLNDTIVTKMAGDLPPFNDWGSLVVDPGNEKVYLYGGCHPGSEAITTDLFCWDMRTGGWKNHTHSLYFRKPSDPFSKEEQEPEKRVLPRLHHPSSTFLNVNGGPFMFLFGGYDPDRLRATSDVIAIDLLDLSWWYVKMEGGPVSGRIYASMVGIGSSLFIFGGKKTFQFGEGFPSFGSYSIAEYSGELGEWRWVVCDQPYPAHVPPLGYGGEAIPVHDDKKILLMPGRSHIDPGLPIDLFGHGAAYGHETVFFHAENRTFSVVEVVGELPGEVSWYDMFSVTSTPPPSANQPDRPQKSSRRKRESTAASTTLSSRSSTSQSVIICTWLPQPDGFIAPELWQYHLPPEEKVTCLQFRDKLWNLDLDLQGFVVVGNRMILLGNEGYDPEEDSADAVFDTCVEIILS